MEVKLLSMKFSELIDKESILLDGKRLAEWRQNAGKFELFTKINGIRDKFIETNVDGSDWEAISQISKFAEEIKNKL